MRSIIIIVIIIICSVHCYKMYSLIIVICSDHCYKMKLQWSLWSGFPQRSLTVVLTTGSLINALVSIKTFQFASAGRVYSVPTAGISHSGVCHFKTLAHDGHTRDPRQRFRTQQLLPAVGWSIKMGVMQAREGSCSGSGGSQWRRFGFPSSV